MNLNQLTISEAQAGLAAHKFTSVELTQACLDQIQQQDPKIHAFLCLNDQVLDQAKEADEQLKNPDIQVSKPLLGIPISVKDNFLTSFLPTTASSKVLDGFNPPYQATVVNKLLDAGALILGKTNMDAWAHGSSTETSDYGPSLNPWDLTRLPGGSSGGSAASVAADLCIASIGSETAGSIRQPAAWCGVTGLKPTYGRVSRYGVVAMASSTDSPGPITKTIDDAATILSVIAGTDPHDATTIQEAFKLDSTQNLKNLRLGLPDAYLLAEMRPETKALIRGAASVFESLGAKIIPVKLLDPHYAIGVYTIIQRSEVSSNLSRYDGIRYGHGREFFGDEAKRRILLGTFSLSSGYYDQYYQKAQKVRTLIINDFNQAFNQVDAILGPVSPGPAQKLGASQDAAMFGEMEDILVEASSIAGLTGSSLPCGFVDNMPIGLQVTGPQRSENLIINLSRAYQTATDWHLKKPAL